MKLLIVFTISLCLLSCQVDKPRVSFGKNVDNIQEQVRELEKKVANLEKRVAANEKRIVVNEERITVIELKMSISKANRIAMIETLNQNGYDGGGWAAEVDAFFDGLTEEQRKEFVKVPMEDFVDLMHSYGLTFPWERR
ncbi:MAG: hypothetical protein OXP71_06605 [Candidatus Poribacteria bacterium]|nr:hypothetical protein [Candidatus Poribacteria bacterium]